MKSKKVIGIIGFGNMGSALASRLKVCYCLWVFDQDTRKTKKLSGINRAGSLEDLLKKVEVVIIAVKPQDFPSLLKKIKSYSKARLFISIAAGISTGYIQKFLKGARVIRVMPNLPAKVGAGMSCLCHGRFAKTDDLHFAEKIFRLVGRTLVLKEEMMDAATAISGSGPGYFYALLKEQPLKQYKVPPGLIRKFQADFKKAAASLGFTKAQSALLVHTTIKGAVCYFASAKLKAARLVKQVASRGGTTEAGLAVLSGGGTLGAAVQAALRKAKELVKK